MRIINTQKTPKSGGHYSQCIEHNGILYLAGQLPRNPETLEMPEGIELQTLQVLENIKLILTEAGSNLNNIIQIRIYLSDIELWDRVNAVYKDFMGDHKPVRIVIPCGKLHFDSLIEIEATACL